MPNPGLQAEAAACAAAGNPVQGVGCSAMAEAVQEQRTADEQSNRGW